MEEVEIWKSLDFLGYPDYEISTIGRVKSLHFGKEKILKLRNNLCGYLYVSLSKDGKVKHFRVHRLVALAFLENPDNLLCVNHKNEIKTDNRVENLEFCSVRYNNTYNNVHIKRGEKLKGKHHTEETKQKISKANSGEKHPMYGKISPKRKPILQFSLLGEFIKEFDSATQASKELNLSQGHISNCCKGKLKTCGGFIWKYKNVV